tara:strand:+ start:87 stop:1946 length:1860 start_codon:yes stop_codon:yes gene_type:complete
MKIPLFTSQAQMSREVPGRSISARMSMAGPRSIIEQSSVVQTALNEVGSYAELKYKMLDETERNELVFGAKEQIRDTAARIARGTDNTIFEGGKNSKWNAEMDGIRSRLMSGFRGSQASKNIFDQEFRVASSNAAFSLREKINDRIEARHTASNSALKKQIIKTYGDPGADLEGLTTDLASFSQILLRSLKNQTINPQLVEEIGSDILPAVAEQLVMGWAGTDQKRVLSLHHALTAFENLEETQDEIDFSESRANALTEFEKIGKEGGNYTLQVLLSVQPGDANRIIQKALKSASSFAKLDEEVAKSAVKQEKEIAQRIYTFAMSGRLKGKNTVTLNELRTYYNPAQGFTDAFINDFATSDLGNNNYTLDGPKVQKFLQNVLRSNPWFQTQTNLSNSLENSILDNTTPDNYSDADNDNVVDILDDAHRNGTLTIDNLLLQQNKLTRKMFNYFVDLIEDDQRTEQNELKADVTNYFKEIENRLGAQINENTAGNSALTISKGVVKDVLGQIRKIRRERDQAGDPMSFSDITEFGEKLLLKVEKEKVIKLRRQFKLEFRNTLSDPNSPLNLDLTDSRIISNPRAALDAVFDSLASPNTQLQNNYNSLLGLIGRFEANGAFN